MKNLSNKILATIERDHLKPLPSWVFQVRNILAWTLAIIVIFFSSITLGLVTHIVINQDWKIYSENHLPTNHLLESLPYIWLGCLFASLIITYLIVKNSKTGYKYSSIIIISISLSISLLIGVTLFETGISRKIDSSLGQNFTMYNSTEDRKVSEWQDPQNGYLGGIIVNQNETEIELQDFQNKTWYVDITKLPNRNKILNTNKKIKIFGAITGENNFQAKAIYAWHSCGGLILLSACED
jgi:hypothetical protein